MKGFSHVQGVHESKEFLLKRGSWRDWKKPLAQRILSQRGFLKRVEGGKGVRSRNYEKPQPPGPLSQKTWKEDKIHHFGPTSAQLQFEVPLQTGFLLFVDWFVIVCGMQKYLTRKKFLGPRPLNFSRFSPHTFHLEKKIEVFLISFPHTQGKKSQGVERREWHWHSHMLC